LKLGILPIGLLLGLAACSAPVSEPSPPAQPQAVQTNDQVAAASTTTELATIPLQIASAGGRTHSFTVELAATPEQQERGLMFRESLAPDRGMLFPFDPPRPASFWMRNTLIPLDMIFIRPDGRIARIAANTVPLSLEPVAVQEPMAAVLELAGGRSAELGIRQGDRVTWAGSAGR
jgi:hypothetical protein